jgi:uncharacterized repeat protein (TIGR03843 family)
VSAPADVRELEALLACGEVEIEGRIVGSSNTNFLVTVTGDGRSAQAVYKPLRGERPLWDFPPGLHRREVAAYRLSVALGYGSVPPTVLRDGPAGEGSFQAFVDADFSQHYFTLFEQDDSVHHRLREICAFDLVANNTDRKSGHVLLGVLPGDESADVWSIDNGLCFSSEPKLRTVIWEFGGEPIDEELLEPMARLARSVPLDLATLLDDDEVEAVQQRAAAVVRRGVYPNPRQDYRSYPWPLV